MRLRNAETGTVIGVGEQTGKHLLAAGWERADERSKRSTATAEPGETKTRRRRSASK